MRRTRIAAIIGAVALVATGTGAAIGATGSDDAKKAEQAILDDAAQRLGTTREKLRDALAAAEDAQLDQAVKDGRLTQEQADRMKQHRRQSGRVLGMPHGGPGMHHRGRPGGPGGPGGRALFGDIAEALGITTAQLRNRLHDGKTLEQIAKAEGKSLADVKASVRAAAEKRLDASVKAGDITQAQADAMLDHLDEHLDHLGSGRFGRKGRHGMRGGPMGPPPAEMAPGAFAPQSGSGTVDA